MPRIPLLRSLVASALVALALSPPAFARQASPVLRLDATQILPEPDAPPCDVGAQAGPGAIARESSRPGAMIDACGRLHPEFGVTLSTLSPPLLDVSTLANARIDSMLVYATTFGYSETYSPGGPLQLVAHAEIYYLDNGTSWESGAGSHYHSTVLFDRVEVSGDTLRYVLTPPVDGFLYKQIDYDSGDHSSQGEIAVEGPLVIVARAGATEGLIVGHGRVVSNEATWYGEPRFNYFRAPVGSIVPFRMRYRLASGKTFSATLFSSSFGYTGTGSIDFAHATRPPVVALDIKGPARIPDQTTIAYRAIARYEGGTLFDVTEQATWSVTPPGVATVAAGVLTVGTVSEPETLSLHARYEEGGTPVEDLAQVVTRHDFYATDQGAWPMYQADSRHTGFLPVTPSVSRFQLLWQRNLGLPLNPVAAGEGRVFCTGITYFSASSPLHALDAATGATLWSYDFGDVFSVNPPSLAYGNVYVQSGNHGSDTWLHAFDAATGERVFRTPHQAQWERYYAPTVLDGRVYVNGGYYGGMYAFDALTGGEIWFRSLPQYDQWTPAVDGVHAYAYVGDYDPGLYAVRKSDGQLVFKIADAEFEWNGWSMDLAPVVGAHDDVLAIHDDRLVCFDVLARRIRWQKSSAFRGQPSVANDVIYALDGGALVALDELTGTAIWSWRPTSDALQEALIVTASLAFVTSANRVYAVSLDGRAAVWSHPVGGHLALANGALYVASTSGLLSAFDVGIGPPLVAHAGSDTTVECAAATGGTHVRLDGSGSEGPDLAFTWAAPGVTFDDPHAVSPTGTFPLGVNAVVLTVSRDGNIDRDTVVVTVLDTRAPGLTLAFEPPVLWPPNHELVHVRVTATPSDACDVAPTFRLVSVTSSEPDGGPGDAFPDDILDAGYGQPDLDIWLRAQRESGGPGRIYTLCYEVRDAAGHAAQRCAELAVPSSLGRAQHHPGDPHRLTVFGVPGLQVRSVDEATLVVSTSSEDVWRAVAGSGVESDVDQDGRTDRTWSLAPVAGSTGTGPGPLHARWRAGNGDYYAMVEDPGVASSDAPVTALRIGLASNPAFGRARLLFDLPADGHVRLTIHDVAGRLVARLVDDRLAAGHHEATFGSARRSPGALLFYRLEWEGQSLQGKFVVME